jgi:hypothetical protein
MISADQGLVDWIIENDQISISDNLSSEGKGIFTFQGKITGL